MKKIVASLSIVFILAGCGGDANDGDPLTDTSSTIPPDTAVMNSTATDTSATINSNVGTQGMDTALGSKSNVRSSGSAYPDGKGVSKTGDTTKQ